MGRPLNALTWDAGELALWSGGYWEGPPVREAMRGFCHDTRELQPGDLFVAIRTDTRDGHDYLESALAAGASGALVSEPQRELPLPQLVVGHPIEALQSIAGVWRRAFSGPVVGVTGSSGKTTARSVLQSLLGPTCHGTRGNRNNLLGVPLTLSRLDPRWHDFAVVEAGIDRPGEMELLDAMIRPDLAVFTLIGDVHLDRLGSRAGVAAEKAILGRSVGARAVFPEACLDYREFQEWPGEARVLAEVEADAELGDPTGRGEGRVAVPFRLVPGASAEGSAAGSVAGEGGSGALSGGVGLELVTPEWGRQDWMVSHASLAVARTVALCLTAVSWLGVGAEVARSRLAQWCPAGLRGSVIREGGTTYFVDCYNSNPVALRESLAGFLRLAGGGPRCFVLGAMKELGAESARLHRESVGELRGELREGDAVVCVGAEAGWFSEVLDGGAATVTRWESVQAAAGGLGSDTAVAGFPGWVFLKGSRAMHLERLLPPGVLGRLGVD